LLGSIAIDLAPADHLLIQQMVSWCQIDGNAS